MILRFFLLYNLGIDKQTVNKMPRYTELMHPVSVGQIDGTDKLNCSVRALANCTDMPIIQAKQLLAKHGRKDKDGAAVKHFEGAYNEAGLSFVGFFGSTKQVQMFRDASMHKRTALHYQGMTLGTFLKTYNRGTYICIIKGHAVCVKGGKLIDSGPNNLNKSVLCAFKKPVVY